MTDHAATATALALALAIGAASWIMTRAKISRVPRVWLAKRKSRAGKWLFELASCPLCTATWLSLAATALYRPWLVPLYWGAGFLVTALAITAVSMLPVLVIRKALENLPQPSYPR
jgi:hypothetical protein